MDAVSKLKQRQKVTPIYESQAAPSPSPTPGFPNIFNSSSSSQINNSANIPQSTPGGSLAP